jgi:2'-5' RNA ligase
MQTLIQLTVGFSKKFFLKINQTLTLLSIHCLLRALLRILPILVALEMTTSCATNKNSKLSHLKSLVIQQQPPPAPAPATTETTSPSNVNGNSEGAGFIPHEEKAPMKSYLAMNLDFDFFSRLRLSLESELKIKLKNRGESHITVITPLEFDQVLSQKLSIQEINHLAEKMRIQKSAFDKICVGEASAVLYKQTEKTYFVVIESEQLLALREAVQKLFISKGGRAQDFNPKSFYPHVTLGYTLRDLHAEDGAIKNSSSCIFTIQEKELF